MAMSSNPSSNTQHCVRGMRMCELALHLLVAMPLLFIIADATPAGFATFFRGSSCPSGWSVVSSAQGRLILTDDGTMSVGLTTNTVLGDREDRTHTHTVTPGFSWTSNDVAGARHRWPGGHRVAQRTVGTQGQLQRLLPRRLGTPSCSCCSAA